MKPLRLLLFGWLLIVVSFLAAADDIDAQIEAIRKAPPHLRYKLMNRFKQKIVQMRERQRIEAIKKLQRVTRSKRSRDVIREVRRKSQNQRRLRENKRGKKALAEHAIERHIENTIEDRIVSQIEENANDIIEEECEEKYDDD